VPPRLTSRVCASVIPGTGKSVLLREIITQLKQKWKIRPEAVAVTAATGIAACHVGGTTLHSWAGIGIGIEPVEKLYAPTAPLVSFDLESLTCPRAPSFLYSVQRIRKNQQALQRWTRTKALIIDEGTSPLCKPGLQP
jgi:ATP-dependent DNA helicase PIF1